MHLNYPKSNLRRKQSNDANYPYTHPGHRPPSTAATSKLGTHRGEAPGMSPAPSYRPIH